MTSRQVRVHASISLPSPIHTIEIDMSSAKNIEEAQRKGDFAIKPEAATPTLNTADWPLLLKVRTNSMTLDFLPFLTMTDS